MKKSLGLLLLCLIFSIFLSAFAQAPEKSITPSTMPESVPTHDGIAIKVNTNKTVYRVGDTVTMEVILENVSKQSKYLIARSGGSAGGADLVVYNDDFEECTSFMTVVFRELPLGKDDFHLLKPGEKYTMRFGAMIEDARSYFDLSTGWGKKHYKQLSKDGSFKKGSIIMDAYTYGGHALGGKGKYYFVFSFGSYRDDLIEKYGYKNVFTGRVTSEKVEIQIK